MRLTYGVRTLAAVLATAAVTAAPAEAKFELNPIHSSAPAAVAPAHHQGSSDETAIIVGALAAAAVVGGGTAIARRTNGVRAGVASGS